MPLREMFKPSRLSGLHEVAIGTDEELKLATFGRVEEVLCEYLDDDEAKTGYYHSMPTNRLDRALLVYIRALTLRSYSRCWSRSKKSRV